MTARSQTNADFEQVELQRLLQALGFISLVELVNLLASEAVAAPFAEFVADFLGHQVNHDEQDFHRIMNSIALNGLMNVQQYNANQPDKTAWRVTLHDHYARLIIWV